MSLKNSILVAAAALAAVGTVQAQATDTLAKIKASGKVTMGVRESSSPLSYTLGGGKFAGYHIDVCEHVLGDVRKALGLSGLTIEYTPVTSQNRIPLVQNGTVDLECGSTTNNTARQQQVAFGLTTYVTEVRTAVNAKSGISSINQLNGKTLVTTTGTTSVQTLRKHERASGINFNEVFGKDHADSFLILESGRADAFVMDDNILAGNIANAKTPADFKIVGEVLAVEPIAVMFRKDDPAFKKAVDDSIRKLITSGEIQKMYAKWFQSPIPPRNINVNLPAGDNTKLAWANPSDNPAEAWAKK
jgi:glutamate/aspartate transport system substrate-binding protein